MPTIGDFTSTRLGSAAGFSGFSRGASTAGCGAASGAAHRRGVCAGATHDLLRALAKPGAPDAHAVVPALHFQLRNSGFRCQIDQLTDFIDCHQWISLAYFARRTPRRDSRPRRETTGSRPRDIIRPYGSTHLAATAWTSFLRCHRGLATTASRSRRGRARSGTNAAAAPMRVKKEQVVGALALMGLDFEDAEIEMMMRRVNNSLAGYESLRKIDVPYGTEPAFAFHPGLPGRIPAKGPQRFAPTVPPPT